MDAAALGCCALLGAATGAQCQSLSDEDGVGIMRCAYEAMSRDLQQCGVAHRTQAFGLMLQSTRVSHE